MKLFVVLVLTFAVGGSCVASSPTNTTKNVKPAAPTIWIVAPKQKIQALQPGQVIVFPPVQPIAKQMPAHETSAFAAALKAFDSLPFLKIALDLVAPNIGVGRKVLEMKMNLSELR